MEKVEIIEAEVCPDHIHILVKMSVWIHRISQRENTLLIFKRHANLKYKYGNRIFWCRGYFVDKAEKNNKAIGGYIKNQLAEDQIMIKEYVDPFTGSK